MTGQETSANCETWSSGPAYLPMVNARSCPSTFFFSCGPYNESWLSRRGTSAAVRTVMD
jgi:hypothetical protein